MISTPRIKSILKLDCNKEINPIFHGFSSLPFGKLMGTQSAPAEPRSVFLSEEAKERLFSQDGGNWGKIWLGDGLIWLGTHPASRGSFCLPKGESKRKAFLARWRVLKKNLGDLWLRLIWLETDPASRGCFCPPERGSKRKALLAGWRVLRKNMIGLPVVLTFSRLPISRTFKGNRKKVRVIGSSKKIAGSKEKKTLLTAQ